MLLVLVLLGTLSISVSVIGGLATPVAMLSRLIVATLVPILIQTVVVLVSLLLILRLTGFLIRRAVLRASVRSRRRSRIAFVLGLHFCGSGVRF